MEIRTEAPPRQKPALAGVPVERVDETHVSWLFFTADRVYKLKKPVDLGFLDFRSAEARRDACHTEVRINRRLAGDVYRGVRHVRIGAGGRVRLGGSCADPGCPRVGRGEDHLVEMRRLPAARALSERLRKGAVDRETIEALARRIHRFHAAAERSPAITAAGSPEAVGRLVIENVTQLAPFAGDLFPAALYRRTAEAQTGFLRNRADRLAARQAAGRIRDGHGDLHLDHVFDLRPGSAGDDRFAVIDGIEFDDRYRHADVAADVAFLAMSLSHLGRDDLAEAFLEAYAAEGGDWDLYRVVDFYVLYRALVRLKVACMAARSAPAEKSRRTATAALSALVARCLARRHAPHLLAVGGPVGSGKSTLAEAIARRLGAVLVGSDATRKRLLGLSPTEPARAATDTGAYEPAVTDRVYAALLDAAEAILDSGRPVVLDATWPTPARRAGLVALAGRAAVPLRFLNLGCDPAVARARLEGRSDRDDVVSDARAEDFEALWPRYEPPDDLPMSWRIDLDTGRLGLETAVEQVVCALPADGTAV